MAPVRTPTPPRSNLAQYRAAIPESALQALLDLGDTPTVAVFSPCRQYRYVLRRFFSSGHGVCNFLMLNPSTADEVQDDPTIRRCIGFARAWGYRELVITNLFAYRATDPQEMKRHPTPVGADNDSHLLHESGRADVVIAAWGTHGTFLARDGDVLKFLRVPLHHLGLTKDGHPKHPLYLRSDLQPVRGEQVTPRTG